MKILSKVKNWFVEEYDEEEEEEDEIPVKEKPVVEEEQLARKVEIPKKSFRERFKLKEKEKEEAEEDDEEEEEETNEQVVEEIPSPTNRIISLNEEEEYVPPFIPKKPAIMEEEEEEVSEEEEDGDYDEELPSRSTRVPLVFEDNDLFQEEEEEEEYQEPTPKEERPLYQGRRESTYLESMRKESYMKTSSDNKMNGTKFKPSPIISPIYGILDKNYKKEEIITRDDKLSSISVGESIDTVRKKAYGDKKETKKEEAPKEKKVDVNEGKPGVSKVTIADADEYYNDLGLAYNVDYKDMSRSNASQKKEEVKEKDDDNLFDLIDSMYKKED